MSVATSNGAQATDRIENSYSKEHQCCNVTQERGNTTWG